MPEGTTEAQTTPEQLPLIVPYPYQPPPPPGQYGEVQTTEGVEHETVRPVGYGPAGPAGDSQRTTERVPYLALTTAEGTAEELRCNPDHVSLCENIGNIILKVPH